jgi:flagellar motility protein MotE (MotC chaperone)
MSRVPTTRLLTLVLVFAFVMLGQRVSNVWIFATNPTSWRAVQSAAANEPNLPQPASGAEGSKPEASPPAPTPEEAASGDDAEAPEPAAEPEPFNPADLSEAEIAVLQNLSKRREEIEARGKELDAREALMVAAEQRIDQKVKEMQSLREEIKGLLRNVDDQQKARVTSMVKIYETMKPREAAAVLEALEMDVALDVLTNMKENKTAPILAAMTPQKASEITVNMMQRQKLPEIPAN